MTDLNDYYAGDGQWFKIGVYGSTNGIDWDVGDVNPVSIL